MLAFKSSTMGWDSSRVTAAIPSGVGFLGAGLIWKGTVGAGDNEVHQVHGLTTAASLWLSAAVGCGAGGGMFFTTVYAVVLVVMVLRFGPKIYFMDDTDYAEEYETEDMDSGDDFSDTYDMDYKNQNVDQPPGDNIDLSSLLQHKSPTVEDIVTDKEKCAQKFGEEIYYAPLSDQAPSLTQETLSRKIKSASFNNLQDFYDKGMDPNHPHHESLRKKKKKKDKMKLIAPSFHN